MTTFRTVRSLLLERDPEKLEAGRPPLTSMRDVTWQHQRHAMTAGYNSLTDMAIDELILLLRELQDRVDALEDEMRANFPMRYPLVDPSETASTGRVTASSQFTGDPSSSRNLGPFRPEVDEPDEPQTAFPPGYVGD